MENDGGGGVGGGCWDLFRTLRFPSANQTINSFYISQSQKVLSFLFHVFWDPCVLVPARCAPQGRGESARQRPFAQQNQQRIEKTWEVTVENPTQVHPASVKRFSQLVHLPQMGRASLKSLGTKHFLVQKRSENA